MDRAPDKQSQKKANNFIKDSFSMKAMKMDARQRSQIIPCGNVSGFTLIEVMVVVLILAILAAVVAPKLLSRPEEARITAAKSDIQSIETSMDLYRMDNFQYPATSEGIGALLKKPSSASDNWKPYLKREPKDPWGNPYKYANPGTHGEIDIYSLGPDRVPSDDDVGNWEK